MEVSSYLYQSPYSSPVQYGRVDPNTQQNQDSQSSEKSNNTDQSSQNIQNAQSSGALQSTGNTSAVNSSSKLDVYA